MNCRVIVPHAGRIKAFEEFIKESSSCGSLEPLKYYTWAPPNKRGNFEIPVIAVIYGRAYQRTVLLRTNTLKTD